MVQLVSLSGDISPDFEETVAALVHAKGGSFSRQSDDSWIVAWGLIAPSPEDGDHALECANQIQKLAPKGTKVRILLHFTELEGSDLNAAASRELLPEMSSLGPLGGSLFVTEAFNRLLPGKVKSTPIQEDSKIFRVSAIKDPSGRTISVVETVRPETSSNTRRKPEAREVTVTESELSVPPPGPTKRKIEQEPEQTPEQNNEPSEVSYKSFAREQESSTASLAKDPTSSQALSKADFSGLKKLKPKASPPKEITLTGHITQEVDLTQVPELEDEPAKVRKSSRGTSGTGTGGNEDAA